MLPRPRALLALAGATLLLAACTSGSGPAPSRAPSTSVVTSTAASTAAPSPVAGGPTTAADAATCPFAGTTFVHLTSGLRLGRVTVLRSGGRAVGCRFYGQQHPNSQCGAVCLSREKLPGPTQPVVEITTRRYASSNDAHNAFVLRAGSSPSVTQVDFGGTTGLCFQDDFDPQDKGADFACTVNKATVLVLVRTVDTTQTTGATTILRTVLGAVTQ